MRSFVVPPKVWVLACCRALGALRFVSSQFALAPIDSLTYNWPMVIAFPQGMSVTTYLQYGCTFPFPPYARTCATGGSGMVSCGGGCSIYTGSYQLCSTCMQYLDCSNFSPVIYSCPLSNSTGQPLVFDANLGYCVNTSNTCTEPPLPPPTGSLPPPHSAGSDAPSVGTSALPPTSVQHGTSTAALKSTAPIVAWQTSGVAAVAPQGTISAASFGSQSVTATGTTQTTAEVGTLHPATAGCGQRTGDGRGLQWMEGALPKAPPSSVHWTVSGVACARLCLADPLCCAHALQNDLGPASGRMLCLLYALDASPLQLNASYVTYLRV